ncbi:(2Fe-2S)-binding protein [Clostridium cochlearium]|uniref:(2Fe-2S)-binding protein n=1 Tax=Clostridium cochlearium TaxID=1494 RepID=UPI000BBBB852|nr:(2Fe-2S)-binding protein [Clostridium cochlearium]
MEQNLDSNILDKLTKICICKAISRSKIKDAIRNGAKTVEEVNQITGAGSGGCNGTRCKGKIEELLKSYKEGLWK